MARDGRMVPGAQDQLDAADLGRMRSAFPARSTPGRRSCATTARWGSTRLLQPAIKAAEEGYVVAPRIAFDWKNEFEKLKNGTNTERYLLAARQAGGGRRRDPAARTRQDAARDRQRRPRRASTPGEIAADMVETLRGIGGLHTLEDFAAHTDRDHVADRHDATRATTSGSARRTAPASPCW